MRVKIAFHRIKFYISLLTILIIVIAFTYTFLFLYRDFYLVITQSEEILVLQKKVAIDTVDVEKFNQVIEKIKEKPKSGYMGRISNPFD